MDALVSTLLDTQGDECSLQFYTVLFSTVPCSVNSSHLGLPRSPVLSSALRETPGLCLHPLLCAVAREPHKAVNQGSWRAHLIGLPNLGGYCPLLLNFSVLKTIVSCLLSSFLVFWGRRVILVSVTILVRSKSFTQICINKIHIYMYKIHIYLCIL